MEIVADGEKNYAWIKREVEIEKRGRERKKKQSRRRKK